MKKFLLAGGMSTALLFSTGLIFAQAVLQISPEQERTVYTNIYGQRVVTETTPDFDVAVGAVLPGEVKIYEVPTTVEYAPVREYRYATVGSRVVLVEPATRRVIRVIPPPSELQREKQMRQ